MLTSLSVINILPSARVSEKKARMAAREKLCRESHSQGQYLNESQIRIQVESLHNLFLVEHWLLVGLSFILFTNFMMKRPHGGERAGAHKTPRNPVEGPAKTADGEGDLLARYRSRLTPGIEAKLKDVVKRHQSLVRELNEKVTDISSKELAQLSKDISNSEIIVEHYTRLTRLRGDLAEMRALLLSTASAKKDDDIEMHKMAEEECGQLINSLEECENALIKELTPTDDADKGSAILEIRAGTGGDEASLFAGELLRMYERYSMIRRWKFSIMSIDEENDRVKEAVVEVKGKDVFGKLKFESGVHRVQRVPATESKGRVQIKISDNDLRIDVFRASGKGGQHVNTTDSAVRITHIPTGISVENQEERSQLRNKEKALSILRARLYDRERRLVDSERRKSRNKQIGTGDRSEKCRTYNFAQNRITDHRINFSIYDIEGVLGGGDALQQLIDQLRIQHDLEELASAVGDHSGNSSFE
ncbi:Peptide chain release factor 1, mitochondrial [Spiromyces aspiralis]|uniref:Peptide chain release factor 1, mitochondrial n=1 Tax=Spiromyces aspiralis TaxID=68401 RepID=A0ACC1HGN0_9FUNG|nr:Peptide chain release factor 1, mitochondrial [Spiromyces aspiralis]